jgi:hypothetical protein
VTNACDDKRVFAFPGNEEMNEARLLGRRDHGETGWRGGGIKVQQQDKRKPVCDVVGEVEMVPGGFAVFVARGDLASGGVDEHVERMRKGGTALDVMIADEAEDLVLREDGDLVVEGAIAKVKGKTGGDTMAVSDLNEIARGEDGAFERFENEESMKGSLGTAYRNRVGGHPRCCCEKTQRERKQTPKGTIWQRDWDSPPPLGESEEFRRGKQPGGCKVQMSIDCQLREKPTRKRTPRMRKPALMLALRSPETLEVPPMRLR